MNKRGLERGIVVSIILIVITLGILLAFFIISEISKQPSDAACHQAVVYRGSIYEAMKAGSFIKDYIAKEAINAISLKCKQKNVVIDDKEKITRTIADEMARCWAMLGEGKVNFFGHSLEKEQQCLICSRITFNSKVREDDEIKITPEALSYFMVSSTMTGKEGITYTDFFAGSKEHIPYQPINIYDKDIIGEDALNKINEIYAKRNLDLAIISTKSTEGYAVVYTMWEKGVLVRELEKLGVSMTATVITTVSCSALVVALAPTLVGSILVGAACAAVIGGGVGYLSSQAKGAITTSWQDNAYVAGMTVVPYNPQGLMGAGKTAGKGMACSSFETIPD